MAITYHVKVSFEGTPEEVLAELKGAVIELEGKAGKITVCDNTLVEVRSS